MTSVAEEEINQSKGKNQQGGGITRSENDQTVSDRPITSMELSTIETNGMVSRETEKNDNSSASALKLNNDLTSEHPSTDDLQVDISSITRNESKHSSSQNNTDSDTKVGFPRSIPDREKILAHNRQVARERRDRKKAYIDELREKHNTLLRENNMLKEEKSMLITQSSYLLSFLSTPPPPPGQQPPMDESQAQQIILMQMQLLTQLQEENDSLRSQLRTLTDLVKNDSAFTSSTDSQRPLSIPADSLLSMILNNTMQVSSLTDLRPAGTPVNPLALASIRAGHYHTSQPQPKQQQTYSHDQHNLTDSTLTRGDASRTAMDVIAVSTQGVSGATTRSGSLSQLGDASISQIERSGAIASLLQRIQDNNMASSTSRVSSTSSSYPSTPGEIPQYVSIQQQSQASNSIHQQHVHDIIKGDNSSKDTKESKGSQTKMK